MIYLLHEDGTWAGWRKKMPTRPLAVFSISRYSSAEVVRFA